ncbi:DUF302 domain-containing protein [Aquicella lusitana]|uniref:Uncharacterized protein (DUF302 family) n=1 Tax=Aquicella lusitana TaxID=254246 RepID=A0A370GFZ1_9COXI|nr:DUF302 domain-containing protein [Aquicella lusitana]RDI42591.1 uncharacterized protein (DUF302 family) [Aquicella lusitana]VVC74369.1 hypothetical protein AQULUS_21350 [Aquicella lusitana]
MNDHDFLIINTSNRSVKEIIDHIENILREKQITIFARINHSAAARAVGLTLQDEEVLIFGNPQVGTALMVESPAIGIELPLKIVAWRAEQTTFVAYHNYDRLADLFHIQTSIQTIHKFNGFLKGIIDTVI